MRALSLMFRAADDDLVVGLASGAPGGDVIFHEACREQGISSWVALPMPKDDYVARAFGDLDSWRSRFLSSAGHGKVLELSDRPGLPRWLDDTQTECDAWSRGNRWTISMAQSWGADETIVLVPWDEQDDGALGRTTEFVRLARNTGLKVEIIPMPQG
ncbi:MAG: hypothetical protein AAGA68_08425 [Pseudomonadota bacterium]